MPEPVESQAASNPSGEVIYQRVSGTIYVTDRGALKSWAGELTVESGERPDLFEGVLVTDDGGEAEVHGTRCALGSNRIEFAGSGPPPFEYVRRGRD